jgi:hypothetical protein
LIVLSDDWGRHPSSCQHLVRRLRERHPTLWVNTIGTRRPRLSRGDAAKIAQRLRQWLLTSGVLAPLPNLTVIAPPMWPGFRRLWQRRLNGALIARAVRRALPAAGGGERRIIVATVPIAAALLDRIAAEAWVYYRVDDFAAWPGLDSRVMRSMEEVLLARADHVVAASPALQTAAMAAAARRRCSRTASTSLIGADSRARAAATGGSPRRRGQTDCRGRWPCSGD